MSVLTEQTAPTSQPQTERANQIKQQVRQSWRMIRRNHQLGMSLLWGNLPEGVTAQDIVDELGTDAGEIFTLSAQLATLIGGVDPDSVVSVPEGVTYTINQDGTVTLS